MFNYVALVTGVVMLSAFLFERSKVHSVKALVLKALSSLFFILTACSLLYYKIDISVVSEKNFVTSAVCFGVLIMSGLVCGLMGDIWLDLKFIYPKDNDVYTYAGFSSFGLGHLFFIAALMSRATKPILTLGIAAVAAIIFTLAVLFTEKIFGLNYGKFKAVTLIYSFVLSLMSAYAGISCIIEKCGIISPQGIVFIGSVFFIISDLILSNTYFAEGRDTPVYIVANHITYYMAQFIIALSVLFL